jgi:hypothetical protein
VPFFAVAVLVSVFRHGARENEGKRRWTKCISDTRAEFTLIGPLQLFRSDSGHHLMSGIPIGERAGKLSPLVLADLKDRLASR